MARKATAVPPPRTRRGRPTKGQLELRKSGYYTRLTVAIDGERVRKWFPLDTFDETVANRKMARLAKQASAGTINVNALTTEAKRVETYAEASARIRAGRVAEGLRSLQHEEARERLYVLPTIGGMLVTEIRPSHIRAVLEDVRDRGLSHRTVTHTRSSMSIVLDALWREEVIDENPVSRTPTVKGARDKRERATLTDDELAVYLAYEHPDPRRRIPVLERQVMSLLSRTFGGLRTGDLHALRWESIDADGGSFAFGWSPRVKTARPQRLTIAEVARPLLRRWWELACRPTSGLVFPLASTAGDGAAARQRGNISHADYMRRDLRRAFGLEVYDGEKWLVAIEPKDYTARQRELFIDGQYTKRVDFHSWRRSFNQALANANVNAQEAAALAGHSSLTAHMKYLANTASARTMPAAALPTLRIISAGPAANNGLGPLGLDSHLPDNTDTSPLAHAVGDRSHFLSVLRPRIRGT